MDHSLLDRSASKFGFKIPKYKVIFNVCKYLNDSIQIQHLNLITKMVQDSTKFGELILRELKI